MNLVVVVPPPFEPVTVAELQALLRWGSAETAALNGLLERNIASARQYAERYTRRAFIEQTVMLSDVGSDVELLRPPYLGLVSVSTEVSGSWESVSLSDVSVTDDLVPRLTGMSGPVRVTYKVGYAPKSPAATQADYAANVPQAIKDAILLGAQLLVDRFDRDERPQIEATRDALLDSYRVFRV